MRLPSPTANGRQTMEAQKAQEPGPQPASMPRLNEEDFKRRIINDILNHIDYQSAVQSGHVEVKKEEITQELLQLSTRTLVAWYEAFLVLRSELVYGGYELNGLRVIDQPADVLRKLIQSDPQFDVQQYIF